MDMIWILVGMPIFSGLYAIHYAKKSGREEEKRPRTCSVELSRRMVGSSPREGLSMMKG
jgi:hypothetical protein